MEHQVFLPVPADRLRAVLRDPARVARCVPGLQQDADAAAAEAAPGQVAGRLRLRVGGNTVTYRGRLSVAARGGDRFTVEGEGVEIRGSGTVKLTVDLRLAPAGEGSSLEFTAAGEAGGRAAGFAPDAVEAAVRRLLDKAAAQLAVQAGAPHAPHAPDAPDAGTAGTADTGDTAGEGAPDTEAGDTEAGETAGATPSVYDTEVPPSSLDPFLDGDFEDLGGVSDFGELDRMRDTDAYGAAQPPAEAAHARRTMIGRSAEEVDHAPPRGRYAPVPAPASAAAGAGLRWIAPAAAFALASAVVIGRALRRRR
ncbi:SRPBCC domain-containing protein [Streptomyces sp. 2P-4]|uniref:SRPBCC family protein n=1 Tax=Streptomyces sp. 2P-4 TaxID=2931974 RepID=UPI002540F48C|nr:SRPBCC domain-containing protein [Streptomyces sp. 2P-4]